MAKKGNRRKTGKEQYYTLPETADACVKDMLKIVGTNHMFLEPCGGEGSFIEALINNGVWKEDILSFDIEPKHELVKKQNFLELPSWELPFGLITITNPPFGRANSLAKKFFNKAAEVSDYIGFIVPRSWRKWSVHNSLDKYFYLIEDKDLPTVCFYSTSGKEYSNENLRCVFQIWERRGERRPKITVKDHGLIEKTTFAKADIEMVIFGWGCGKVIRDFDRKKKTTSIYLKVKNEEVIKALEQIDFSQFSENVAYTQALSLKEINYLLNKHFDLEQ